MFKIPSVIASILCASLAVPALAQEAAAPDAKHLLRQSMEYARALKSLSFDLHLEMNAQLGAKKVNPELDATIVLSGDKSAFVQVTTPQDTAEVYSDGETQHIHWVSDKKFEKSEAPDDRVRVISSIGGNPMNLATQWLSDFLHNKENILTEAQTVEYVAKSPAPDDETPVHQIKLSYPRYDMQLWLGEGEVPLPEYIQMDLAKTFAKEAPQGQTYSVELSLDTEDWSPNVEVAENRFVFDAPEGVTEMTDEDRQGGGEPNLVGKKAPDLTLDLLGGGQMKLADLKGKVVLLDFWATWCGPCRMAMPVVEEVANAFKDKNVVVYAVNLREEEATIQGFMQKQGLEIPVALDRNGDAASAYGAQSIPRTVIIDKEGNIADVHSGFSPYLKNQLQEKLTELTGA